MKKLPIYLNGVGDEIFYIPKRLCNLNIDESLYKVEDLIQEEVHYKNYLRKRTIRRFIMTFNS